ncbi:RsmB/NOP family class I SAM-dependent RNA methyltransferase [Nocardioides rubriscoriae]|uniref:RsmB/NOP family class I SAM-dependent RNA methyltransferase n=1 Tax=Nocardioides rubriscoriae TaxID=642762 RepID=UPI0011DFF4F2|nr:transcription antitermination factor NusB [Nocardioides rubriscoriae]
MAERRRGAPVDAPRRAAWEVLKAVRVDDAYANLVLPAVVAHFDLEARDAAFTTELASGTLRWRGLYDAVLAACSDRSLARIDAKVLDALRLGTHQLLGMRVPTHAAISTTVDLVRAVGNEGAAGFANAVLRKVSAHDHDAWVAQVAPGTSPRDAEVAFSHPAWIVDELRRALGPVLGADTTTELGALLRADNEPPKVTLVARPGRATVAELPGDPTPYSPYGVTLDGGRPHAVPAVAEGRAGVQDEGSQLVAIALARADVGPEPDADRLWLDLCAGPGGKSALLAALAAERGARLLATERAPHRAGLVAKGLRGADGVAGVLVADGRRPPLRPGSVDRVLVDAPCTGLGALRRRPEARWRRRQDDLLELVLLQRALLGSALDLVRPGGVVLYATCSPVLAETSGVVTSVLDARRDVVVEDVASVVPEVPDCAGPLPGTVQLWPHRHGTDAMFLALLRRTS